MSSRNAKPLSEEEVEVMWALFGSPPVLSTEDKEAYYNIRKGHVAFYRPGNMFHLKLVRELVDTEWEMFGLVRIRTKLLNQKYRRPGEKESGNLLERPFWGVPEVDKGVDLLDRIDKWRNTATVRRNNLLKLLEYYCPASEDNPSIPEAEHKEVEQNQKKQIAAPPLAPTETAPDHITVQNSSEAAGPNQTKQIAAPSLAPTEESVPNDIATQNPNEPVERAKE